MPEPRRSQISDLYQRALARPPAERQAFLSDACGENAALREEVESLLRGEAASSPYLETPAAAVLGVAVGEAKYQVSAHALGHYILKERVGTGGMGEVYCAHDSRLGGTSPSKSCGHSS